MRNFVSAAVAKFWDKVEAMMEPKISRPIWLKHLSLYAAGITMGGAGSLAFGKVGPFVTMMLGIVIQGAVLRRRELLMKMDAALRKSTSEIDAEIAEEFMNYAYGKKTVIRVGGKPWQIVRNTP